MLYDTAYLWNLKYAKMDLSAKQKPTHPEDEKGQQRALPAVPCSAPLLPAHLDKTLSDS